MGSGLTRRELLKQAARLSALAAIGGAFPGAGRGEVAALDGLAWHKAPCRFCGTGCGVLVGVKGGRVVAVQGDPENPVNRGLLCAKGYHVGSALYGTDRLTRPMVRKSGKLVPVSWDEAIGAVAQRIMRAPEKFAFYGSGQWTIPEGYLAMKFTKGGLGSNHIDPNARLCMASAVVGFIKTFGVDEPSGCYDDLDECDTLLTWGNNWAEMHPVLFSRFIDRKGASTRYGRPGREDLTYVDLATRWTRSSEAADHYLEFNPHTDLAIANCICQQLVARGTYDKDFVEKHLRFKADDGKDIDFATFAKFLEDYTPEKVSTLSGVPRGKLEMLGDLFSDKKRRIVSLWCMGVNQHTRGTAMNNLIYNVHRDLPGGGHPGPRPPGRPRGGQRPAPQGGRGGLAHQARRAEPEAWLPHGEDVPVVRGRGPRFDVGPGHQPGAVDAQPERDHGQRRGPLHGGERRLPDGDDEARGRGLPLCDVGGEERRLRELRAPHPAVVQAGGPARRCPG
jgi:nitrate reductase NapA